MKNGLRLSQWRHGQANLKASKYNEWVNEEDICHPP